jgi:hypothetical protein
MFFQFKLEPDIALLTVTRSGMWELHTVAEYERALRAELVKLSSLDRSTAFIVDIRSSGAQRRVVADALSKMVAGLGALHADRTAVVTASGLAKLQAKRVADPNARVFTSMVLARDWVIENSDAAPKEVRINAEPSDADAEGIAVHVHGPDGVDILFTPQAALQTAQHIEAAAVEVLMDLAASTSDTRKAA